MNLIASPLVLLSLLAADGKPTPKFPLGKETTYVIGPLDREGYIDYEAALNDMPDLGFYPAFIKRLETCPLQRRTHWVRIYQWRHRGEVLSNEVLLDNHPWEEMQAFMADQPWPVAEKPYDVGVLLVIKEVE